MAGHHDRRNSDTTFPEPRHGAEAVEARHAQIEQHAPALQIRLLQKLFCACIYFGRMSTTGEKVAGGGTNMRVVVNDVYQRQAQTPTRT